MSVVSPILAMVPCMYICNCTCLFSFLHAHTHIVHNPLQGYAIFAKVEEGEEDNAATNNVATNGYAKNYFDDFFNSEEQEIPSHNEPVSVVWWCTLECGNKHVLWVWCCGCQSAVHGVLSFT